jgi:hypothetical protein
LFRAPTSIYVLGRLTTPRAIRYSYILDRAIREPRDDSERIVERRSTRRFSSIYLIRCIDRFAAENRHTAPDNQPPLHSILNADATISRIFFFSAESVNVSA